MKALAGKLELFLPPTPRLQMGMLDSAGSVPSAQLASINQKVFLDAEGARNPEGLFENRPVRFAYANDRSAE